MGYLCLKDTHMRVIAEIPHSHLKITIFDWNEKYVIKLEIGQFEQSFKISHLDVDGLDGVKALLSDEFLESSMHRFLSMREDFHKTYTNQDG
jgi:hypothetical protein